ncbi:MAG: M55 family metallopeptidase [Woeseia sp.]|nr:M55 family metallopeptidase [Woeseia sp.]NNE61061.1 M55 family metallopeptidase [Woeseia sp.]
MSLLRISLLTVLCCWTAAAIAQDNKALKVYISADMEGVAGAVTDAQLGPDGFEYQRFREFMTAEVLACIEAARDAGATEILVSDSHGNGQNLLIEKLPDDVTIVRSWPRVLGMMAGIDDTFDAVIFLGYHSSTENSRGVRAHTMSSANVTALRINGISMSEGSVNAAIAGDFGVPVVMVSGDDVAVAETRVIIGDVEGAVVKWAKGFHSAETLTPAAAREVISARTKDALDRLDDFQPYVLEGPLEVDLSLKHYRAVELLAYLPSVERLNSHTVRFIAKDMTEASMFLSVALGYRVDLQP